MLQQRKATKEIDPEQKKRTVDEIARKFPNVQRAIIEKCYDGVWNTLAKDAGVFEHIPNLVKKGVIQQLENDFVLEFAHGPDVTTLLWFLVNP